MQATEYSVQNNAKNLWHYLISKPQVFLFNIYKSRSNYNMQRNIIFYFSDQQRADTISRELTPNLFNLANEGTLFENHYTCQPVCGPARACLQTGVYATKSGCFRNAVSLPDKYRTIGEYFKDFGYDTAYIGKWHLASDFIPGIGNHYETKPVVEHLRRGYNYWRASDILEFTSHGYGGYVFDEKDNKIEFDDYRADAINRFALEYLDNRNPDKPFFMFISQLEPHHQNDTKHFEGYKSTIKDYVEAEIPGDLSFLPGNYNQEYPDYLSAINRLDYNVGLLIEKLKQLGIYDNTDIIYTSDHGCHFKTRNLEYKRCCHENTIKVPLIIKSNKLDSHSNYSDFTSLIDLPATLLDLAGIEVPSYYDGFSIVKMADKQIASRNNVYIQISESQCGRAVRYNNYLYSVRTVMPTGYIIPSSPVYHEEYLYDLEKDPYEKNNIIKSPEYKDIRRFLKKLIREEAVKAGEIEPVILPALRTKKV